MTSFGQAAFVGVGAYATAFLTTRYGVSPWLALIAGVALSTFPYALDVTAKVTSLRDFFVTLFFVGAGLSRDSLRRAGFRPLLLGAVLWCVIAATSLALVMR